jgi:hypothetical protein
MMTFDALEHIYDIYVEDVVISGKVMELGGLVQFFGKWNVGK